MSTKQKVNTFCNYQSTCAKDGGANQSKTTMPPLSEEYRNNWDEIFGKKKIEPNSTESLFICEKVVDN